MDNILDVQKLRTQQTCLLTFTMKVLLLSNSMVPTLRQVCFESNCEDTRRQPWALDQYNKLKQFVTNKIRTTKFG